MNTDVDVMRSEVEQLRRSQGDIERLIQRKQVLILKALPATHGYPSMDAFIHALARFATPSLRNRVGVPPRETSPRKKGRRYDANVRASVRQALEAHEPAASIAKVLGVSLGTIAKWKREWGIGRQRRSLNSRPATPAEKTDGMSASSAP